MIIYKVTNLVNGKIYIGKTVRPLFVRKRKHLYDARKGSSCYFHRALIKNGLENFIWETIDRCLFSESLSVLEQYYISKFNSMMPNGYNGTFGGDGTCGRVVSQKTKEKQSAAMMGHAVSPETVAKIIAANKGRHHTDEQRKKISVALKGRTFSEKHRLNLSKSGQGKTIPQETRSKISASLKGNKSLNYGKHPSIETRLKLSVAAKAQHARMKAAQA